MEMQPQAGRDFSYGDVIRDALSISWRNRFLWIIALLPALIGSVFGLFGAFSNLAQPDQSGQFPAVLQNNVGLVVGVGIAVALVLLIASIFISVVTAGAMTGAVADIDRGDGSGFGPAWRTGLAYFWRVFWQGILKFLIFIGLFLAPAVVCVVPVLLTFLLSQSTGLRVAVAVIFSLLYVLLWIALVIPASVVFQYALRDLVVRNEGAAAAISSGYRLFRSNPGRSLLVFLIYAGLAIALGILSGLVNIFFNLIFLGPSIGLSLTDAATATTAATVIGQMLILIPSTILSTLTLLYFSAYWTVAYLRLSGVGLRNTPTPSSAS